MTDSPLILSIDNGTQSMRAILFNLAGQVVHKVQLQLNPYESSQPGWAEQDPNYWWEALCKACQQLWQESRVDKSQIKGVSVTTQRSSVINLDKNGRPLRPAILWLDNRHTNGIAPVSGLWGLLFKLSGHKAAIERILSEAESNWIRTHQPDIWKNTDKYLLLSGWLNYKLTGEFVDSTASQVGFVPFDFKHQRWAKDNDWRWDAFGIEPTMLPRLITATELLGAVSSAAATATGIPVNTPVFAAAADKACEVLGAGALSPDIGCLSFGTTATINVMTKKYRESFKYLSVPYPAALPGYYNMEFQIFRGFWLVRWFKEQFGYKEEELAKSRGTTAENLFDDLVNQCPAGAMGLIVHPFWTPSVLYPGPESKGAMIGFGDVHTRAHLYRAILEGLIYSLREGKERIEEVGHFIMRQVIVSGGGSQSNAAMQITASIFGLPASRPKVYETSSLGAAIDVALGLNYFNTVQDAVTAMCHTGDVFEPIKNDHDLYNELYRRVYKKIHQQLKPLYEQLRKITGYPE